MLIGKVVNNIWATRKHQGLEGFKLMVVHILEHSGEKTENTIVAIDNIGAGIGDLVLVAYGSAAQTVSHRDNPPIDAAIVAIVDEHEFTE